MSESSQELLDSDMHLAWLVVLCKRNSVLLLTISFIWPIFFSKLDVIVGISVVRCVLYVHHQQLLQWTSLPKLLVGFSPSLAVMIMLLVTYHTGKCIRRFGGIYVYCRYFIDRKW